MPNDRRTGHGDHDYLAPVPVPYYDESSNSSDHEMERRIFRALRRRLRRDRRERLRNTDHDYVATSDHDEDDEEDDDNADRGETLEEEGEGTNENEGDAEEAAAPSAPIQNDEQAREEQPAEQEVQPSAAENAAMAAPAAPTSPNPASGDAINNEPIEQNHAAVAENSASPSPPKKRKRLSKCNTPKVKTADDKDDAGANDEEEDDGLTCPICLDNWEMSGPHRLVSLRCGHLFGDACIRRWLAESARQSGIKACPQCKTKAATRDIRCLYAKRLRAIDRSEEHRLREELHDVRLHSQALQSELNALKLTHKVLANRVPLLVADNERMRHMLMSGSTAYGCDLSNLSNSETLSRLQSHRLFMERNIEISREPGCRVLTYAAKHSSILASQKSAQGLFPGYGVRFIDTPTFRTSTFLHTSAKMLRDICLSADQQLLAVASMETRSKLFDLRTRQVVSVFEPNEKPLWACTMDRQEREHFLYLGGSSGSAYVYDVRFPETVVDEFKTEGDLSPVINIAPVATGKNFPNGGFLVCKLQSIWFYEYTTASGSVTPTRLDVEGPFSSMCFDAIQETLLISARCSERHPQSRYILGKIEKIDGTPHLNVKVTFSGSKATPVMTRCTQLPVEANTLVVSYIQDAKLLALFDVRREQCVQSLPVQEVVYDICPVYSGNTNYLAALTETKCRMYKLSSTAPPAM